MRVIGSLMLLSMLMSSPAQATPDGRLSSQVTDGVHLDVRALSDRAVFCITAETGHKIAAGFGVELSTSPADRPLWLDSMPKYVTDETENYFHTPLAIDLKSKSDVRERSVHVKLGSCYLKNYCKVYDFDVKIPKTLSEPSMASCGK